VTLKDEFFRYVSVSGGKDSTAVYIWAIKEFGSSGFRAVFADTTHEHPVTVNYLKFFSLVPHCLSAVN